MAGACKSLKEKYLQREQRTADELSREKDHDKREIDADRP